MIASSIRAEIVAEKISYVRNRVEAIRSLPLSSYEDFSADTRNVAAAESYLRRALEATFDIGRHILAKAFSMAPAEYKQIAEALAKKREVSKEEGRILREMAGYRNRMVHFYHEIGNRSFTVFAGIALAISKGLAKPLANGCRSIRKK
jgi:uncharacterized protein YutE (UPF0331/DUF86 family)